MKLKGSKEYILSSVYLSPLKIYSQQCLAFVGRSKRAQQGSYWWESSQVQFTAGVIRAESDCCPQLSGDDERGTSDYSTPHQGSKEAYQPRSALRMKPGLTGSVAAKSNTVLHWKSLTYFQKRELYLTRLTVNNLPQPHKVWLGSQLQNVTVAHRRKTINNSQFTGRHCSGLISIVVNEWT